MRIRRTPLRRLTAAFTVLLVSLSLGHVRAAIDPAARALADAVSQKIGSAKNIQVTAQHRLDPRLGVGARVEKGAIEITVQRPNRFYAIQPAGEQTREIAYDGRSFCLMHAGLKHHAVEPLKAGSIDQLGDRVDEKFGFRPPVAELLAQDVAAQLFENVTSARVVGTESVGWTRCERLHFEQPGMTGDLWVGVKDKLPRRYLLTFTDIAGHPTWDIKLSKWTLNGAVNESLFSKRPAADSVKIKMLKSR